MEFSAPTTKFVVTDANLKDRSLVELRGFQKTNRQGVSERSGKIAMGKQMVVVNAANYHSHRNHAKCNR